MCIRDRYPAGPGLFEFDSGKYPAAIALADAAAEEVVAGAGVGAGGVDDAGRGFPPVYRDGHRTHFSAAGRRAAGRELEHRSQAGRTRHAGGGGQARYYRAAEILSLIHI